MGWIWGKWSDATVWNCSRMPCCQMVILHKKGERGGHTLTGSTHQPPLFRCSLFRPSLYLLIQKCRSNYWPKLAPSTSFKYALLIAIAPKSRFLETFRGVHKWRQANLDIFGPPPPLCHTFMPYALSFCVEVWLKPPCCVTSFMNGPLPASLILRAAIRPLVLILEREPRAGDGESSSSSFDFLPLLAGVSESWSTFKYSGDLIAN